MVDVCTNATAALLCWSFTPSDRPTAALALAASLCRRVVVAGSQGVEGKADDGRCGGGGGKQQFLCVVGVLRSFVGLATKWIADS